MRPLSDPQRMRFLRLSACMCVGTLFLAPLVGRTSIELSAQQAAFDRTFDAAALATDEPAPAISINRDPFDSPETVRTVAAPAASASTVVGMTVRQGEPMGYTVPNGGSAVIRAIVSGSHPTALAEESGKPRVV